MTPRIVFKIERPILRKYRRGRPRREYVVMEEEIKFPKQVYINLSLLRKMNAVIKKWMDEGKIKSWSEGVRVLLEEGLKPLGS